MNQVTLPREKNSRTSTKSGFQNQLFRVPGPECFFSVFVSCIPKQVFFNAKFLHGPQLGMNFLDPIADITFYPCSGKILKPGTHDDFRVHCLHPHQVVFAALIGDAIGFLIRDLVPIGACPIMTGVNHGADGVDVGGKHDLQLLAYGLLILDCTHDAEGVSRDVDAQRRQAFLGILKKFGNDFAALIGTSAGHVGSGRLAILLTFPSPPEGQRI